MSIGDWSDDTTLVNLPWRLQEHDELQEVVEIVQERSRNVVVDFSSVGGAGGATLARLLQLRQVLQDYGRTLVLCSVAPATRGVFTIARLDGVFRLCSRQVRGPGSSRSTQVQVKGARMILGFFIKQYNFFDLSEEQVGHAMEAARFFKEVVAHDCVSEEMLSQMAEIEHQGDNAAHTIIERLNKTFITPFDRQDIHALATELDDITDMIHNIVSRLAVYHITGMDENLG